MVAYLSSYHTPLGMMQATIIRDRLSSLCFESAWQPGTTFTDCRIIKPGKHTSDILTTIIDQYFTKGIWQCLQNLFKLNGTPLQTQVWQALQQIPTGETRSYSQIATMIGRPTAQRAVATAVAANPLAILVPCHRVVRKDGKLGGYNAGVQRKRWLLEHEQK